MSRTRATTVIIGQVVVAAGPDGLETAEAIGLADGRVVSLGAAEAVRRDAARGFLALDAGPAAVVPGLHDFHLHLVGMARARHDVNLASARDPDELIGRLTGAVERTPTGEWIRGGGWAEALFGAGTPGRLEAASRGRAALLYSHDRHSAWASGAALRAAGMTAETPDPAGGRIERDARGTPTGILREHAVDPVEAVAGRLSGAPLEASLLAVAADLAAAGITGATDAGDTTAESGVGEHAFLGDRASRLLAAAGSLDGRLRLSVNLPADTIAAAAARGWHSGMPVAGSETIRLGWAKIYADGALGSRTAAVFDPYPGTGDRGILRLDEAALHAVIAAARDARIAVAIHAIGDRAVATALDALGHAARRHAGAPADRLEHLQLVRGRDLGRLATLDVTASVQPTHAASDRATADELWDGSRGLLYPWRSLADAGATLAFGSDAPIETADPWVGIFTAAHRRFPSDESGDWRTGEAVSAAEALAAYTIGPARAAGRSDEGHLRVGAVADLAVLNVDLETLLAADERLVEVRSELTMVAGREVPRARPAE